MKPGKTIGNDYGNMEICRMIPISQFGVSQRWIYTPREVYEYAVEGLVARVTSNQRRDWDLSRQTVETELYDRIRGVVNRWRKMLGPRT